MNGKDPIALCLPHGAAFHFVDRVVELAGARIAAEFEVPGDHPVLQAHFPGTPIWPGVYVIEGLAQTAGILLALHEQADTDDLAHVRAEVLRSSAARDAALLTDVAVKLRAPVGPGDLITYEVALVGGFAGIHRFTASALVGARCCAEGTLALATRARTAV